MNKFQRLNNWINENSEQGVTVIYPGGFRPLTGGHLDLIKRYSEHPDVKEVIVIVGPKTRNGITQDIAVEIAKKLTEHLDNVRVEESKWPSPILTAYKMIENLEPGKYALAASSKGDDYKRVHDFTTQHQLGGKYYEGLPEGVKIVEMPIDVEPALFRHGKYKGLPISASILRKDILNNDWESFTSGYPENSYEQVKYIWDILQGIVTESTIKDYENILNEASVVSSKNRHMTHAEDLVILAGKDGLDWVLKTMWNLYEELKGNTEKSDMKLSVKIDGAPAIFAWTEFHNELPKNGIALKGLFAKTPKIFTNDKEIEENYGDKPDLAYKLKTFLKYLPDINIPKNEIWQGDFLFDDESIKETTIEGEKYYAFHPNTIYYVVPQDSDLGKLINKAKVGIAWHTRYTGPDLENIKANYNTDSSELRIIDKMLMTDPYIKSFAGLVNFTEEESDYVESTMEQLLSLSKSLYDNKSFDKIIENKEIVSLFNIFQNSLIRENIDIYEPSKYIINFREFLQKRAIKEREKMKSEKGKQKIEIKFAEMIDDFDQEKETWLKLITIIIDITELKQMFINKLNNIGKFQTYLKMKEGNLRSTNQEGFAVSDIEGNVIKLVDRKEFSWSNFSPEVQKGWESDTRG